MQIFAYGQTGSGKTYCMGTAAAARAMQAGGEGEGVIPRAVRFIFDALPGMREHYDVSLKARAARTCDHESFLCSAPSMARGSLAAGGQPMLSKGH